MKDSKNINPVIFNAAFRYALVEYSKPFGPTNGLFVNGNNKPIRIRHDLTKHIPCEHSELHERIITLRNQFHAHADMTVFDPTLNNYESGGQKITTICRNIVHGCDEFKNVDEIIDLIMKTLDSIEIELESLKEELG